MIGISWNGTAYDGSRDYSLIDKNNVLKIHEYFKKKCGVNWILKFLI